MDIEKDMKYITERMMTPYTKLNQEKSFLAQHKSDEDSILGDFYNDKSEVKLKFELFSWLANEDFVYDINYCYELAALNGYDDKPFYDVFIETIDDVVFIDHIYTQVFPHNINKLSKAYYEYKGSLFHKIKGTLSDRYYGHDIESEKIRTFILDIKDRLSHSHNPDSWMNYRRAVSKLIGLYLFLNKEENKVYLDKNIKIYTIYYDQGNEVNDDIKYFFDTAKALLKELLGKDIVYEYRTTQEVVAYINDKYPNVRGFASNELVKDILSRDYNL